MYFRKADFLRIFFGERSEQAAAKKCPGQGVARSELEVASRRNPLSCVFAQGRVLKNLFLRAKRAGCGEEVPGQGVESSEL